MANEWLRSGEVEVPTSSAMGQALDWSRRLNRPKLSFGHESSA